MAAVCPLPSISVAICSQDRPVSLDRLLRTLWAQTVRPLEVVLVDPAGLPRERLEEWARQAAGQGIAWRVLRVLVNRRPRLRNLAADAARGEVILFLDEDLTLGRDYVEHIVRVFAARGAARVGGVQGLLRRPAPGSRRQRWLEAGLALAGWGQIHQRARAWPRQPLPRHTHELPALGANAAYRKAVFAEHRFDEHMDAAGLYEDQQFSLRVARTWRLVQTDQAIATQHGDPFHRPDWYDLGRKTVAQYFYTLRTAVPRGFGERLVTGWTITLGTLWHWACSRGVRAHSERARLAGMWREYFEQLFQAIVPDDLRQVLRQPLPSGPPDAQGVAFLLPTLDATAGTALVLEVARELKTRGHRPALWTMHAAGPLAEQALASGIPVRAGLQRDRFDPSCAVRLARYCRRDHVDTLVAVGQPGDRLYWSVLSRLHHNHRVAALPLAEAHATSLGQRWLNRLFCGHVTAVVAAGDEQARVLQRDDGLRPEQIRVVAPPTGAASREMADLLLRTGRRA